MTVLGLCGVGTYLLHRVQMERNASSLLDRARSAEAGGNLLGAEEMRPKNGSEHPSPSSPPIKPGWSWTWRPSF